MLKYYYFQLKRVFRVVPYVLLCLAVLAGAGFALLSQVLHGSQNTEDSRLKVAMCGDVDHPYFELGLNTVQALDDISYSMHLEIMDEMEARLALEEGRIDAYVIIPDDFMDDALGGDMRPLKYISASGAVGITALLRDEITNAISKLVVASQTAMLAFENLYIDSEAVRDSGVGFQDLSVTLLEYVLIRADSYALENLGLTDPLGLEGYLTSGICVLLIGLLLLPFGYLFIRKDMSLQQLMASKNTPVWQQSVCQLLAMLAGMLTLVLAAVGIIWLAGLDLSAFFPRFSWSMVWGLIPVVFTVTAFGYFLFAASGSLVGGLLLYFFSHLAMSFVSGCMYPLYFFPKTLQAFGSLLPFSFARMSIAQILTGDTGTETILPLLAWGVVFVVASILIQTRATHRGRR